MCFKSTHFWIILKRRSHILYFANKSSVLTKKVKLVSDQRNDLDYMDEIPPSDVVRKEFSLNSRTAE